MSVLCEAINVIVRCDVLAEHYPSGVRGYRLHCPNRTYCSDGLLTRVGFMSPYAAERWIGRVIDLASLSFVVDDRFGDIGVVDQFAGVTLPCDWLASEVGDDGLRAAWLVGADARPMAVPREWQRADFTKWGHDEQGRLRATTTGEEVDPSRPHYST